MKRAAAAALLVASALLGVTAASAADDPTRAPTTTTSADGRSVTDGRRTLTIPQARDLKADPQTITVEGSGYDNTKGIYVAFCVIPASNQTAPGPCGGGQDRGGQNGGAVWVSSNPPVYARGLTTPYGKGGTFKVTINVQAQLNETTDCRVVHCAVTTRNDHTRSSDRSQDVLIPVYFAGGFGPPAPGSRSAPATTPTTIAGRTGTTTTTTIAPQVAAPLATISADRLSISGGGKTLRASEVDGLGSPAKVRVQGTGFDTTKGIYVSLCFISATLQPGPCASGSAGQSAWISSNPPDFGKDLAKPYGDGGSFDVSLTLDHVIDSDHDCSKVACAISTRNDDTHADDRSQDLLLPVSWNNTAVNLPHAKPDFDENRTIPFAVGLAFVAVCGGGALVYGRLRRRARP